MPAATPPLVMTRRPPRRIAARRAIDSLREAPLNDIDPFLSEREFGGALYMPTSSAADLMPGQFGNAMLATMGDFSLSGWEVLLHYKGDPTGLWDPQVFGQQQDPETVQTDASVPEPAVSALLMIGSIVSCRRRRHGN